MDIKNIGATTPTPPPPGFTGKGEAVSRGKEAVSLSKAKGEAPSVGFTGKREAPTVGFTGKAEPPTVGFTGKNGGAGEAVKEMQEVLREALNVDLLPERELQISFEKELNRIVFKVLDKDSGELIRQIPLPEQISIAKDLRAVMERMTQDQSGIAVDQEV